MPLNIAQIGNFGPPNSTENDLNQALQKLGHTVFQIQEERQHRWEDLITDIADFDMVLWTRTASLAAQIPEKIQRGMQLAARRAGVPTVGYHLDRWWGLDRETDVLTEPWFQCEWVFTADGGHQEDFAFAGVNHHWMPPAIAARKVMKGAVRKGMDHDVAFVGSWRGGYHEEWQHRPQMIDHLRAKYNGTLGLYPQGNDRIDGEDRADLFASSKVIVGDSCLVPLANGDPMYNYCSDRVFETIGQGGLLLHPLVDGVIGNSPDDLLQAGVHCLAWELWNWDDMDAKIAAVLANPKSFNSIANAGYNFVKTNHTYKNRMQAVIASVVPLGS